MITDAAIREQGYIYFLQEAPELLQIIEEALLTIKEDKSVNKVHSLMRAAHTLKGSAANVELDLITTVAHYLEDAIKALYNPELEVDTELQTLLLDIYECLRLPLMAEIQGGNVNKEEILDRASHVFIQLEEKLGDYLSEPAQIPTSVELGFDIVKSLFETGVKQRIQNILNAVNTGDLEQIRTVIKSESGVFVGLAESLNLPGFESIAKKAILALDNYPDKGLEIGKIVLENYQKAYDEVIEGDRTVGGTPSDALLVFATEGGNANKASEENPEKMGEEKLRLSGEIEKFKEFLMSDRYDSKQKLKPENCDFYVQIIEVCLNWFEYGENLSKDALSLDLIVPKLTDITSEVAKKTVEAINNWVEKLLNTVQKPDESKSNYLYKEGTIFSVILALVKYSLLDYIDSPADYKEFPLVYMLQKRIVEVANNYKKQPILNEGEKNWIEKAKQILAKKNVSVLEEEIQLDILPETSDDEALLLTQIWGQNPVEEVALVSPVEIEIEGKKEEELTGGGLQVSPEENPQVSKYFQTQEAEIVEEEIENQPKQKSENYQSKSPIIKQSVRVDLEELQRLNYLTGNLLINQNRQILQDEQVQESVENIRRLIQKHQQTLNQLREWSNLMSTQPDYQRSLVMSQQSFGVINNQGNQGIKQPQFDWLEFDNYTEVYNLFNLALEETLQLTSLTETIEQIAKQLSYTLEKQQRLLSHVRDDLTAVQMSPLGDILNRFIQMIDQLSKSKNKPVELKISGGQVLVDKAIAEKLYDPLLHLVRNAFDHGIESGEIREQRRKPLKGQIEIRAYHLGNHTIIEIKDDGEGLDFEAIKRKAVEKNFVSANEVDKLSKSQLLDLLFEPGFSTAKTLSDISGRGIGLDIVKNQLQTLKGSIRVESQQFIGTTFMLKIPFSLTSAKFFVCQGGNATYALLSESIMKIVLPLPGQIQEFEGKKVLQYGAEQDMSLVPVYKLSELINYNDLYTKNHPYFLQSKELPTSRLTNLFLLKGNGGIFALEIDQIIGEQELVIRPVGNAVTAPSYIFGCSILGDGRLILAIDGAVLVESATSPKSLPLLTENKVQVLPGVSGNFLPEKTSFKTGDIVPVNSGSNIKKVLVVDDSMSHRHTLALNLQKAGYEVYQAQDGLEGIDQLEKNPGIELVICDLEMPKMNGFEFLNQWRQNTEFAQTPVLILTSRNSEKHRMLALQLGASAYFTKPYLEQDFLSKISDLLEG